MQPLRIRVVPLGQGYIAESRVPAVTAFGSSVEEAAENARLMATAAFDGLDFPSYPSTLIVRIDEPGRSAIAMQSMDKPFSLTAAGTGFGTCYFDSDGNAASKNR